MFIVQAVCTLEDVVVGGYNHINNARQRGHALLMYPEQRHECGQVSSSEFVGVRILEVEGANVQQIHYWEAE